MQVLAFRRKTDATLTSSKAEPHLSTTAAGTDYITAICHAALKLTSTHYPVRVTWRDSSCSTVSESCYYQVSLVFPGPAQFSFILPHSLWCKSRCMVLDLVIRGQQRHFRVFRTQSAHFSEECPPCQPHPRNLPRTLYVGTS